MISVLESHREARFVDNCSFGTMFCKDRSNKFEFSEFDLFYFQHVSYCVYKKVLT